MSTADNTANSAANGAAKSAASSAGTGAESGVHAAQDKSLWHKLFDWRPKSTIPRILVVLTLVLPLAGAATFMWAMWDPSKYLRDVSLAVVNEDEGVERDGEYINYGNQVVEGLLETDYLNFSEVDKEQGDKGLTRGDYLFVVTIPKDFSDDAVTIISDNPRQPNIHFAENDFYGTNGAVITNSLIPQVQSNVANAISKKYADKVIAGLDRMGEGLNQAAEGAGRLDEGAGQLKDGGTRAVDGISRLDKGASDLQDGAGRLHQGTTDLKAGTTRLHNGVGELSNGAARLQDGSTQLANGTDQLLNGTDQLADGAGQIDAGVNQLTGMLLPLLEQVQGALPDMQPIIDLLHTLGAHAEAEKLAGIVNRLDPANQQNMVNQLNRLREGTGQLHYNLADPNAPYRSGVIRLQDGAHRLNDGINQLNGGVSRLADGASQLDNGAARLNAGTGELTDGVGRLKDGTTQLNDGGGQLMDGMTRLKDGTSELSTKLADGAAKAPNITKPEDSASNIAVPINFTASNEHPVQTVADESDPTVKNITAGAAILVIVVFGYLAMALLSTLLPHIVGKRANSYTVLGPVLRALGLISLVNFAVIGFFAGFSVALGWSPDNWAIAIGVLALTAITGSAVFQFLRILFGRMYGGVFSLGLFALGLFVFGGIWPLDTTPGPLRMLHSFHPMSYTRDAFMRATDGLYDATFWGGLGGLLVFALLSTGLSLVIYASRRRGAATELEEEVEYVKKARLGEEPATIAR
ncbi:YhgE/Pip domain-containing protein [Corynebacterium propinquum]|uniref:YhgE/Pip domain-containing protein n=1 Tax=Corynebacterium propinquum TaxID=43769 RepID=UPI0006693A99|nr:YhgE/Pip domain-containing protein [Corynebacterium propinquum]